MHRYMEYGDQFIADKVLTRNMKPKSVLRALVKPLFFLFKGMHSGALFRRVIEEECWKTPLPSFREVVMAGLGVMCASVLDTPPGEKDPNSRLGFSKDSIGRKRTEPVVVGEVQGGGGGRAGEGRIAPFEKAEEAAEKAA